MNEAYELKSRRRGWAVSITVHLILLLFFWFYNIWPFSPAIMPEFGVAVNFGVNDQGSGDIQNDAPPSVTESEQIQETPPAEQAPAEANPAAAEEVAEESDIVEDVQTTDAESDVNASETSETVEEVSETVEDVTEPVTEPTETVEEAETESETETESESTAESTSQQNNNGDDADVPGDKGQENGEINDSDIYKGKPGGGGGAGAQITGWYTEGKPKDNPNFKETGKIVFKIKIDDEGEVISVITHEKSVSSTVELYYKAQVERLSFERKDNNDSTAPFSEGYYTVILQSK